jgi:hypothetical protein
MIPKDPSQLILLHEKDNVFACRRKIHRGDTLLIDGTPVQASGDIDVGHKLARIPLAPGDVVLKYGVPIGSITEATNIGEHVHTHNMKSDYIAITTRRSTGEEAKPS